MPLLILLILLTSSAATTAAPTNAIGICHGRVGSTLPSPSTVLTHLTSLNITKLRLFNPDPTVLPTFSSSSSSSITLTVGVPNENLTSITSKSAAAQWLKTNLFAHISPNKIQYLAVGNEILYKDTFYTEFLVPAMRYFYEALLEMGLEGKVKVSTVHAAAVLGKSYPPSAGEFDGFVKGVVREILGFLKETDAPFMVNVYPFISYCNDPVNIPLGYASFGSSIRMKDGDLTYTNLFDATVDSFVSAMEKEGFSDIPIAVMETGWPTAGNDAATPENAEMYNAGIVRRVVDSVGTPRRPGVAVETFLFDMYDENEKTGAEFEKHFGILNVDGNLAYNIKFV